MWYALLIPVVCSIIAYIIWSHKITLVELFVPTSVSFFGILISYFALKSVSMEDIEYNGHLIKEVRYYEYWCTWVKKTCSERYACGTYTSGSGKHRTTHTKYCTRYYDCSYCDENQAHWKAIDDAGNEYDITQEKYNRLVSQWNAKQEFVDLNRDINYHGSCGKDGDMYRAIWNEDPNTSEANVTTQSFTNPVKVSHSAFQYPQIEDEDAKKIGLFAYPEIYNQYKQKAILGLDSFNTSFNKNFVNRKLEYLNGYLGPRNKIKIFTLLFKNKPIDIAFKQEAYWDGGNQNELIVCISLDDTLGIQWVKPFSWCDNKRICVDTKEDIAELKKFDPHKIYDIYMTNVPLYFKYKSFKDFNYLSFEPTTGQILFVYILTIIITILTLLFVIKNEFDNEIPHKRR